MNYDVIIIGAGPAGLSAAIYAKRFKLNTLVISKDIGGNIALADIVENYPGFKSISGKDLVNSFYEHAKHYGAEIINDIVIDIEKKELFEVKTYSEKVFYSKSLIIATGEKYKKLGLPKENELKGISYCATCDAPLFNNKVVAVVGGGDTAISYARILSQHANKVYLIHRRKEFRAAPIDLEKIRNDKKIEILTPYVIKELIGDKKISGIVIEEVDENLRPTGKVKELKVDGLFVAIGLEPNNEIAIRIGVKVDENGYIIVDDEMKTNVEGVFAAGDVTNKGAKLRQVVLAAAQGAIAAFSAFKYIKSGIW